jgi:hypothetical protein
MLSTIPTGQFIGSTIEHFVFLAAGTYVVFCGRGELSVRLQAQRSPAKKAMRS